MTDPDNEKSKYNKHKDDELIWQEIIKSVTPLTDKGIKEELPPAHASKKPRLNYQKQTSYKTARQSLDQNKNFPVPGIDRRTEERLRRGKFPIDATLDLHGMTQAEAQRSLESFLFRAWEEGKRCILVITGKGKGSSKPPGDWMEPDIPGVLKRKVPQWLRNASLGPIILRTAPAKPYHGGQGALYVLLRRKRRNH